MRTPRVDKNGLKKGSWSTEEDRKLIDYINKYRIWNWSLMPEFAGLSRNGKSCRLRWVNYLDPNIRRGNITNEEEKTIIDMYSKIGSRWSKIAAKLPGRSDNEIKNYWHTHLKKLFKEKPKKKNESLAIEIPKLDEAILENSYESNNLTPSVPTYEASNSQDIQEIDQVSIDSSETIGDLNSFWTQPFFAGNIDMEYEEKEVGVEEWYQKPLSPYGIFNNEYWLNKFQFMDGAEQPDVYYKDVFEYAMIS